MEKIEFEQDNINAVDEFKLKANLKQRQVPAMVKFLVKMGVKDEKTATIILISISVIFILLTLYITFSYHLIGAGSPAPRANLLEILSPEQRAKIPPQILEKMQGNNKKQ